MEQLDYHELLTKYQYSYTKPPQQLVQLLQALPHDEYPQLFSRIEGYDRLKVKRLLRVLKKPH
jgi:hypothetical protein